MKAYKSSGGHRIYHFRRRLVMGFFFLAAGLLVVRGGYLQLAQKDFLQDHGDARYLRTITTPANRGMLTDRNGEPLAISTPVSSVWALPRALLNERRHWQALCGLLGISLSELEQTLRSRLDREFVYLKRHIQPQIARRIMALQIDGVHLQKEYRRYYPSSEVTAHVVGFNDVDDHGQEGMELAFDARLSGKPGKRVVLKDNLGRIVEQVEQLEPTERGTDIALSIDRRLQYVAYRDLKAAIKMQKARAGSVVILDADTGEVLAMVNQPSYNPNTRKGLKSEYYRNRVAVDTFEPGSTIKPFTVAAALDTGAYDPATIIDTTPGYFRVGRHTIRDIHNYGVLNVADVIKKSSNVGATKIALSLQPEVLWQKLSALGFGLPTDTGFPGEVHGYVKHYSGWRQLEQATLAFGYGLSVTSLQLAQAYMVVANDGMLLPLRMERSAAEIVGERVIKRDSAIQVRRMLESVVQEGTGKLAKVPGYSVAGKTGTVHKTKAGGYADNRYVALFAGMIPAVRPKLVAVVMIDEPTQGRYFGGLVAAPVFSKIMTDAVRLLDIRPDRLPKAAPTMLVDQGRPQQIKLSQFQ